MKIPSQQKLPAQPIAYLPTDQESFLVLSQIGYQETVPTDLRLLSLQLEYKNIPDA